MAKIDFDTSGFDNMMNDLRSLSFDVECPGCRKSFSVSVRDVGSTVTCPNCGSRIKIESEYFSSKLDSSFNRPVELFCFFPDIADTSHKFLVSFQLDLCCLSLQIVTSFLKYFRKRFTKSTVMHTKECTNARMTIHGTTQSEGRFKVL